MSNKEGGGDQAYSRLSTTHGHINDCRLDSVVYADEQQRHVKLIMEEQRPTNTDLYNKKATAYCEL